MKIEKMRAFIIQFVFYCIFILLAFFTLKYVLPLLMPFFIAFLFAFILKPLIALIVRKTKLPRKPVAILLLITFYIILAALFTVLGSRVVVLLRSMFHELPAIYTGLLAPALVKAQTWLESVAVSLNPALLDVVSSIGESLLQSISGLFSTVSSSALTGLTGLAASLPSLFVKLLITIIASFFFVVDYFTITGFIARQLPQRGSDLLFKIKRQGVDVLLQFGKAYAVLMSITFLELVIGFMLLRVENALLLALCISIIDILPILGVGTILIPWGIAVLILGNVPLGAGLLILYLIITVVRQTLEPRVVGKQIGLYPLITLICMFVGGYLFGILGLFGLPILATILLQLNQSGEFHLFK